MCRPLTTCHRAREQLPLSFLLVEKMIAQQTTEWHEWTQSGASAGPVLEVSFIFKILNYAKTVTKRYTLYLIIEVGVGFSRSHPDAP